MISNPCTWFAKGGSSYDQMEFIYEGGTTLYHLDYHPNLIFHINVIFFANSPEHAHAIVIRMLEFRIQCAETRVKTEIAYKKEAAEKDIALAKRILKDKDNWKIIEAPVNQFYIVGWASNDTIL